MAKIFIELGRDYPYPVHATQAGGEYSMAGKLGDDVPFSIYFTREGVLENPPAGATFVLELKNPLAYEDAALVRVTEFTAATDGDAQAYLEISPAWHSAAVLAILEPGGARQPRQLHAMAEIAWQAADDVVHSSASFPAIIKNDIIKEFTSPPVPVPDESWPSSNVNLYDGAAIAGFGGGTLNELLEWLAENAGDANDKLDATTAPDADDDGANTGGNGAFSVGSLWVDTTGDEAYRCLDASTGAAVWVKTTMDTAELATVAVTGSIDDISDSATYKKFTADERNTLTAVATHPMDSENPHGVTASQLGLGSVENTADADKPVSTAQQAALDLKREVGDWFYIIIAGQSNALGRGTETASISKDPVDFIEVWNHNNTAWEVWDLSTNTTQLLPAITGDGVNGSGPTNGAYNFAWTAAHYLNRMLGVKCRVIVEAEGSETIDNFTPDTSSHWARLETQLAAAAPPQIDLFMWHQGETDRADAEAVHEVKMENLVAQVKALNESDERTVFVAGETSEVGPKDPSLVSNMPNRVARALASDGDPMTRFAPTSRLDVRSGDEVHFSGPGIVTGGMLFAQAYMSAHLDVASDDPIEALSPEVDFNSLKGLVYDGSDVITSWTDQAAGLVATPTLVTPEKITNSTTGGDSVMADDGRLSFTLPSPIAQPCTIIALVELKASDLAAKNQVIINAPSPEVLLYAGGSGDVWVYKAGVTTTSSPHQPGGDVILNVTAVMNGASSKLYEENVSVFTGDAGSNDITGTVHLGNTGTGASQSDIQLLRVLIFDRELTTEEITTAYDHLKLKNAY